MKSPVTSRAVAQPFLAVPRDVRFSKKEISAGDINRKSGVSRIIEIARHGQDRLCYCALVCMLFVLTGCPGNKEWKSTAPAGKYGELITTVGAYSFNDGKADLEIFQGTDGFINYRVTNGGGRISLAKGSVVPNTKWTFVVLKAPLSVWHFNGGNGIFIYELRDRGTIFRDFETSPNELKKQIPANFLAALPQSIREKINIDAKASTAPETSTPQIP